VKTNKLVASTAYYSLNAVLLPATITGFALTIGKLLAGRRSGISTSAQAPLFARVTQNMLGTREDEPARRLIALLPNVSPLGLRLASTPMLLAHRLTGYVPRAYQYPFEGDVPEKYEASARTTFLDAAVARYLDNTQQFVILGAGFDTRAYRLPASTRVRSFEVDAPKTQAVKREVLQKAGIDSSNVTFVAANFENEDWLARLGDAGFDRGQPSFFLWEGVTMYLDREAVEATLRKIASCAKGSVVTFDFFTSEAIESRAAYWRFGRAAAKAAGEPLKFGVDSTPPSRERIAALLRSCGLELLEHRALGPDTEAKRAWGGFATAVVK
jgi:methyltransferase (TIGR00027 family)